MTITKAAHTPGPWIFWCEGQPVVFWTGFDRSEIPLRRHLANARLIAAAPDNKAVSDFILLLNERRNHKPPTAGQWNKLVCMASAAIAKAKGGA